MFQEAYFGPGCSKDLKECGRKWSVSVFGVGLVKIPRKCLPQPDFTRESGLAWCPRTPSQSIIRWLVLWKTSGVGVPGMSGPDEG